jgi:hypothetical protein
MLGQGSWGGSQTGKHAYNTSSCGWEDLCLPRTAYTHPPTHTPHTTHTHKERHGICVLCDHQKDDTHIKTQSYVLTDVYTLPHQDTHPHKGTQKQPHRQSQPFRFCAHTCPHSHTAPCHLPLDPFLARGSPITSVSREARQVLPQAWAPWSEACSEQALA